MNRVPTGLLGLLDAKTSGFVPDTITREIRPVLELGDSFIAAAGRTVKTSNDVSLAIAAGSFVAPLTVPAGKVWFLHSIAVEVRATGACTLQGNVVFTTDPSQLGLGQWATWNSAVVGAVGSAGSINPMFSERYPRPYVMTAGNTFSFYAATVATPAALTVWFNALVTEVIA